MKRRILQMLFIVMMAIFVLSTNILADNISTERMAMLENLASIGDQASIDELRQIRQAKLDKEKKQRKRGKNQTRRNFNVHSNPAKYSATPANPFITVEASGVGVSHDEALRDAFKDAVRKVVGVYAITLTKTTSSSTGEDMFDQKIYLNADAVVTKYQMLQKTENDGVITIKIKATVVKNDLLKYVKPKQSTIVSDTEIANLINKNDVLNEAEKSLEYIFKDYGEQVFTVKRVDVQQGPFIDNNKKLINLLIDFEIAINLAGYKNFSSRLQGLLDKISLAKKHGRSNQNSFYREVVAFRKKKYPLNSKYIAFYDYSANNVNFKVYVVHNKIYNKIRQFLRLPSILFQFYFNNQTEPAVRVIARNPENYLRDFRIHTNFYFVGPNSSDGFDAISGVVILNRLNLDKNGDRGIVNSAQFSESFWFNLEALKNWKECKIKSLFGIKYDRRMLQQIPEDDFLRIFGKKFETGNLRSLWTYRHYEFHSIYEQERCIYSF